MFPLNLPNVLTVLRIMAVPVLVVALLGNSPGGDVLAAAVFALASLTDFIDGYLARARDAVTTFGKLMDPLADKLLVVAALISLVSLHRLAAWVAMVIITRELAAGQGQDMPADRRDPGGDRGARAAAVGQRAALHRCARHGAVGAGLLLRVAPAHGAGRSRAPALSSGGASGACCAARRCRSR
jgi:hypothetical protein